VTDNFESEVQKFVGKQNGDELTPQIVYGMLQAVDQDAVARHQETVTVLRVHCTEAVVRDLAIRELQDWRRESSEHCQERIERIVRAEHGPVHDAHMALHHAPPRREGDPPDVAFVDKRKEAFPTGDQRTLFEIILGWSIVKWLLTLAVGAVVVWGVSYWASSCAAQKVEEDFILSGGEVHLITPSPAPATP
jgi:hypothetical protein